MELISRRFFANLFDRTFLVFSSATISYLIGLNFLGFIVFLLVFDFLLYVIFRSVFRRTPGDISFGIIVRTKSPSFIYLGLRWLAGYLSPLTGFLIYIPAENGRSFCDFLLGIKTEVV